MLFAASIRDNIAVASAQAENDTVEAAAQLAGAHDFILVQPQGYDTRVGERGVTLSTGQRQRIAVARAAMSQGTILVLDEPTTALDDTTRRGLEDALFRLAEGRTTLLVTHDLDHASRADRILHLEHGRIVEQGTHAQLLEANGGYARRWHSDRRMS